MRTKSAWIHLACLATVALVFSSAAQAQAQDKREFIQPLAFMQASFGELGKSFASARTDRVGLLADRMVYHADEMNGQFLALFLGRVTEANQADLDIELQLKNARIDAMVATRVVSPVEGPKLPVLVAVSELAPGDYTLTATLQERGGKPVASATVKFSKTNERDTAPPFPAEGIPIRVHRQGHLPDGVWPIVTGVPMPKATLLNTDDLAILENGTPVPAQFITRATWTPQGYVKWVGVDFQAKYDGGAPRGYRLVRNPQARVQPDKPCRVQQTDTQIIVETGAVKFMVGRRPFTGIEKAWLDRNGDGQYTDDELIVDGRGGSFVVDNTGVRYESARDMEAEVVVEEQGPMRVALAAKGWHTSARGEKLCKYVVRLWAYAGRPYVSVSHRTVNTIADQYEDTRLKGAGFEIVTGTRPTGLRLGLDGDKAVSPPPAQGKAFSVHQDRSDHFRMLAGSRPVGEGKRLSGWISAATQAGEVACVLRDVYQKFPRELEAEYGLKDEGRLVLHFWPKHGHVAYTEQEELARDRIYNVRYAHQGEVLEFLIPDNYHKTLAEMEKTEGWAGGDGQLMTVRAGKSKMQSASSQGTVIGSEFFVWFSPDAPANEEMKARADLVQQSPHGLADAVWNCATNAFGPIAPRDPEKYGPAEKLMDTGFSFYRRAIIDAGDEYGMWTYGGVHNNWWPAINAAGMKRNWQMSHYQNVFQAWMLYYRSGLPEHFEWARMHSSQHMDIGVSNYVKYPPGKHSYSHLPDIGGGIYHCKNFMPWAGNNSTLGHWIDVANYFARYYLTGDRRGLDMAEQWMLSQNIFGGLHEPTLPPPKRINPREVLVPLGEFVQYYQGTWDPQAIARIETYAKTLDVPFVETNSPSLCTFGKHWQDWYYELSRDPRVVQRIKEYMEYATPYMGSHGTLYNLAAFLYRATGEESYLQSCAASAYDAVLNIYENPDDRYDQYSLAQNNPSAMIMGRLPFLFHAMNAAGIEYTYDKTRTVVPTRGGRMDSADKWIAPPRGWTNAGVTILANMERPTQVAVSIDGPKGYGDFRGHYMLFHGFVILNIPNDRDFLQKAAQLQTASTVTFPGKNVFNDPPEQRNATARIGQSGRHRMPYIEKADNAPEQQFYHLEYSGFCIELPAILDAETMKPVPQVAVLSRTMYWNGKVQPSPWRITGAMHAYMRALDPEAVVGLKVVSTHYRYWEPTTIKITDADGKVVIDSSVFMAGERKDLLIKLDPKVNPSPWFIEMSSAGDNTVYFAGVEELFFAVTPEDFDKTLPYLKKMR